MDSKALGAVLLDCNFIGHSRQQFALAPASPNVIKTLKAQRISTITLGRIWSQAYPRDAWTVRECRNLSGSPCKRLKSLIDNDAKQTWFDPTQEIHHDCIHASLIDLYAHSEPYR